MLFGAQKTRRLSVFSSHFSKIIFEKGLFRQSQRLALPAGGWDEITPFYRNQLQAKYTPENAQTPTRRVHAVLGGYVSNLLE